ncbi:BamA/TamA family outer membrane protein [Neolewinella antarctica]|uniref:Outer membrane protein assembly factor BamA n=1 Tax=Neolewinella antarctica TaxID=442734 RepID=A0ABX0XD39_9BACT|nr:BamA/TamA family outer membrane protein [Neolewinella antarctica]NJC27205.1 outer membrane protein assembly factor BamA [Neolewinella antarctica]
MKTPRRIVTSGMPGKPFVFRILLFLWALSQVPGWGEVQAQATLQTSLDGAGWENFDGELPDSIAVRQELTEWRDRQHADAYWEAAVDTFYQETPNNYRARTHLGPRYVWRELRSPRNPVTARWAKKAGFTPKQFTRDRALDPNAWNALRDSIVSRAANDGYPFAAVGLDSIAWSGPGELTAKIDVQPGPLIRIGEVRYSESVRVRDVFLRRYLGLIPGEPYRQKRVRRMAARLEQLPYLSNNGPPRISFQDSLAFFDLPLQKRSASRFDFVIGVLPGSGPDGGILFTGDLNGELYNGFGQGERIVARFEQLRPQTQELALLVDYPYVLGLPFGVEGELDLYRRDSSFLNLNWRVAATYLREGNDRLSFFWENRRTIVPGQTVQAIEQAGQLPDTLGISRSFFGISASRTRTDRRFSPRRGYAAQLSVAAGFRTLLDVPSVDSTQSSRAQLKIEGEADYYVPIFAGTVLYGGLRGAALFGDGVVLPNEQYRIGGANLLRGFDEQSVFARDYLVATVELRLLLGGNAYLYAFADAARVNGRNKAQPELKIDYPLGLGAGVNFETRAGIFGLSLALGRSNGIPLDVGNPKVHLGYLSVF